MNQGPENAGIGGHLHIYWTAAARFAVALNISSALKDLEVADFEDSNILNETRDAIVTLQGVLEGKHDEQIQETLNHYAVPRERWWSALYRAIEGTIQTRLFSTNLIANTFAVEKRNLSLLLTFKGNILLARS